MARKIANTPTLEGKDAERFYKLMNEPPTKKHKEIAKFIKNKSKLKF